MTEAGGDLFQTVQKIFGANVRARRQALGWTQSYLGERAGLAKWEITRIEQGIYNVTLRAITGLAEALGEAVPEMMAPMAEKPDQPPRTRSIYRD